MKQILGRYGQLFEFSEFPWYILRHIFWPQDRKTIKKGSKILPSAPIIHEDFSVLSTKQGKKHIQLPLISTANQMLWHCSYSQSALRPKSGRCEHKRERVFIRPKFRESTWEKMYETAKLGPDLRLGCGRHCNRLKKIIASFSMFCSISGRRVCPSTSGPSVIWEFVWEKYSLKLRWNKWSKSDKSYQ